MKAYFEFGNKYARKSDWTDFALTKFCLFSMGVLVGVNLPLKAKKTASAAAAGLFAVTYLPLMKRLIQTFLETDQEE